jgi:sterol desaturase/sphingolipid hydroxylase (fatty acid hydroxylase superfamily)
LYTLLKSEVGAFPEPAFPRGIDLAAEDRKARRRLYPVTAVYATYFSALLLWAFRSSSGGRAVTFAALGVVTWTLTEYLAHRYVLHGVFPAGNDVLHRGLHYLFDASHADHHARPWDGLYINGHLDTLLAAGLLVPPSFLAPPYTASVAVAAVLACYALEEWIHHATHFWNFDSRYFQYVRRRHLWHHSRHGAGTAYGITSGIWDTVFGTRVPERERARLRAPRRPVRPAAVASPSQALSAREP